jgi:hypothetical protein
MFRELKERMSQRRGERRATKPERARRKAEAKAHRLETNRGSRNPGKGDFGGPLGGA